MALASGLLVLILSILFVGARTQPTQFGEIPLGSQLSPISETRSWLSPSGHFAFGFFSQGNGFAVGIWVVGQPNNTVVWTANRDDEPVSFGATIHLSEEGKLFLRTEQGNENLIANVSEVADSASMLDSGNFVLYNGSSVIWQSFDHPTDTILVGQNLTFNDKLVSSVSSSNHSSGRFILPLQTDGNLVAYPKKSACLSVDAYWSSDTFHDDKKGLSLYLNNQGFLLMDTVSTKPVLLARSSYSCNNKTTIFRATLDADGIFRLYSHCSENKTSWIVHIEWSALDDQCNVRGFCDFNSYCTGKGTNADCSCYPGFAFIDPSERFSGCYKNVTESFCTGTDEGEMYDVITMENISFERYSYSVLDTKKENCGLSCLKDCLCDVALYNNERCEKYTAPIRYGIKHINASSLAFFKVKRTPVAPPLGLTIITESKKSLIVFLAIAFGVVTFLCIVIGISTFCMYRDPTSLYEKLSGIISMAGEMLSGIISMAGEMLSQIISLAGQMLSQIISLDENSTMLSSSYSELDANQEGNANQEENSTMLSSSYSELDANQEGNANQEEDANQEENSTMLSSSYSELDANQEEDANQEGINNDDVDNDVEPNLEEPVINTVAEVLEIH